MITLKELYDLVYTQVYAGMKSEKTFVSNTSHLISYFGEDTRIEMIDADYIDQYIIVCKDLGNKPATINRKLSALSKMLNYALHRRLIVAKPFIQFQREDNKKTRVISRDEESRILNHFLFEDDLLMAHLFIVGMYTGLRMNELLNLTKSNYRNDHLILFPDQSKSGREEKVHFDSHVQDILRMRSHTGMFKNINYRQAIYRWNKMKEALLIEDDDFTPHAMRHTFCSRLADKGVDAFKIKDLARHSSVTVTQRYVHNNPMYLRQAVEKLTHTVD